MRFACPKDDLINGVNIVQKAMATKSPMPILEGVYIDASKEAIKLICNDMVMAIETVVGAHVWDEGKVVLPGRIFTEFVRKLPNGEVEIEADENLRVTIRCMGVRTTLQGFSAKEYPILPTIEDVKPIEIKEKVFKEMIRQTIFAVSIDDTRPILTGTLLEIENGEMNLVALDNYRLALRKESLEKGGENQSVVVPGKSLNEIAQVLNNSDRVISLVLTKHHFLVDMGYTRMVSRILEGEFFKYRQILPSDAQTRVKISLKDFTESVERASLMAKESKNNLIRVQVENEKISITANAEVGNFYEELMVYQEGKELEIAFNAKYLIDALKNLDEDEIYLNFTTNVSPCVIKPIEGDKFFYLILPVRVINS